MPVIGKKTANNNHLSKKKKVDERAKIPSPLNVTREREVLSFPCQFPLTLEAS